MFKRFNNLCAIGKRRVACQCTSRAAFSSLVHQVHTFGDL